MPRRRLGVVLLVPGRVADEVDGLRRALGDGALGKVPPHLTLVPPVNVREDDLPEALRVVREAAASTGPLHLSLGPVESFLPVNPVVYLGVGGPGLATVHRLRERFHDGPLSRSVDLDFVPHVTVANELAEERIPEAMSALGHYRHVNVVVRHLHLLQEGDGRVWHPIAGIGLGPPAVVGRGGLALTIEVHDRVPPDVGELGDDLPASDLVLVGRRDDAVVGLLGGRVRGTKAWLEALRVDPEVEHEGVGSHLLAAYESEATDRGATQVYARAEPGARAESFLAGRGFAREDPPPMVRGRVGPVG
jgi:2'-5' RNA ligase/GNAT superfamily N-acetyltransferase